MRASEELMAMFHNIVLIIHNIVLIILNIVLIILSLVLIGVLTAIFETLGLKKHPYVALILAACIIAGAYIHWGYHTGWQTLIVIGLGFAYLQVMKEFLRPPKKESS